MLKMEKIRHYVLVDIGLLIPEDVKKLIAKADPGNELKFILEAITYERVSLSRRKYVNLIESERDLILRLITGTPLSKAVKEVIESGRYNPSTIYRAVNRLKEKGIIKDGKLNEEKFPTYTLISRLKSMLESE
jgi:hypothetical protein